MTTSQMDISEYVRFIEYLTKIRSADYPYGRFLSLLMELPRGVAKRYLFDASYHESMEIRCEVLYLAARLFPLEAGVRSVEMLKDECESVRIIAIGAIVYLQVFCEASVLDLLIAESNGDVRYAATASLGEIGTSRSIAHVENICATDKTTDFEGRLVANKARTVLHKLQSVYSVEPK